MENTNELLGRLSTVKGVRFAHIDFETRVKTASAYKDIEIVKAVSANVQIFGTVSDYTDVYLNAVKKSAKNISENNLENIENFIKSATWWKHIDNAIYSIVKHIEKDIYYLHCIFNSVSESIYFVNGVQTEKADILQYLTPSEAKKLSEDNSIVYNKTNDILHEVHTRTIQLDNIKTLKF